MTSRRQLPDHPRLDVEQPWEHLAACRDDPDGWFGGNAQQWALAAHICVRHCPVLAQCGTRMIEQYRAGVKPIACVRAGLRFNQEGTPRRAVLARDNCRQCAPEPVPAGLYDVLAQYARIKAAQEAGR